MTSRTDEQVLRSRALRALAQDDEKDLLRGIMNG